MHASFPNTGEADTGSILHASRDLRVNRFLLDNAAFTPAIRARVVDRAARAVACRAGTGNAEKALLIPDLSASATGAATGGSFALRTARAITLFAKLVLPVGNLFFSAECRFFKFYGDVFAQVSAAPAIVGRAHAGIQRARRFLQPGSESEGTAGSENDTEDDPQPDVDGEMLERMYLKLNPDA